MEYGKKLKKKQFCKLQTAEKPAEKKKTCFSRSVEDALFFYFTFHRSLSSESSVKNSDAVAGAAFRKISALMPGYAAQICS